MSDVIELDEVRARRKTSNNDGRHQITLRSDVHENIFEVSDEIAKATELFKRDDHLVTIVTNATDKTVVRTDGSPRIEPIKPGQLQGIITKRCKLVMLNKEREYAERRPPTYLTQAVFDGGGTCDGGRGYWDNIRELTAITEIPVLRSDCTIITTPGYDATTGIMFVSDAPPVVLENPTKDDAFQALQTLLDLVCDFRFLNPIERDSWAKDARPGRHKSTSRSAWLAGLLTPFARHAIECAPITVIDANMRGSGKSMLTDTISQVLCGRSMPRTPYADDDAECGKKITGILLAGDALALWDNVNDPFGGASIDALMTGVTFKPRILGTNNVPNLPNRTTWFATGNNVSFQGDTSRRSIVCTLDSTDENPEDRTDFAYPNLRDHVLANRNTFVVAALTILRAYHLAGRPGSLTLGSFEAWSKLVRSAIVWLGEPDPVTKNAHKEPEIDAIRLLHLGWMEIANSRVRNPRAPLAVSEVIQALEQDDASRRPPMGNPNAEPQFQQIREALGSALFTSKKGYTTRTISPVLEKLKGRPLDGLTFHCVTEAHTKVKKWWVGPKVPPKGPAD